MLNKKPVAVVKIRMSLEASVKIPVGDIPVGGHYYSPAEKQEMALNQRARANAKQGNTLLASWMQESADRLKSQRESIIDALKPYTAKKRQLLRDSAVIRKDELPDREFWHDHFSATQYDVQGDALYDDEAPYDTDELYEFFSVNDSERVLALSDDDLLDNKYVPADHMIYDMFSPEEIEFLRRIANS